MEGESRAEVFWPHCRRGLTAIEPVLWHKDYAAKHGHVLVDYHSARKDERGGLPAKLSEDGVHPLPAGYEIMAPLAQAGIEKALAR